MVKAQFDLLCSNYCNVFDSLVGLVLIYLILNYWYWTQLAPELQPSRDDLACPKPSQFWCGLT